MGKGGGPRLTFLNSKEPANALAGYLTKYKKLQYLPGIGWWIAGVPWPPPPEMLQTLQQTQSEPDASAAPQESNGDPDMNGHQFDTSRHRPFGRRRAPFTQNLIDKSVEILREETEPMRSGELFRRLVESGITFPENWHDPQNRMAGVLGHAKQFRSHGRAGWTLIKGLDL
jgi:hypothetical protein